MLPSLPGLVVLVLAMLCAPVAAQVLEAEAAIPVRYTQVEAAPDRTTAAHAQAAALIDEMQQMAAPANVSLPTLQRGPAAVAGGFQRSAAGCTCGITNGKDCNAVESHCISDTSSWWSLGQKICWKKDLACAISHVCDITVCTMAAGACPLFGAHFAALWPGLKVAITARNSGSTFYGLTRFQKAALQCRYRTLDLDAIQLVYSASFLNDVKFPGGVKKALFMNVAAQTWYNTIFISDAMPKTFLEQQTMLGTIAHELHHVKQFHAAASNEVVALGAFGAEYMSGWCKAGFSYDSNPMEKAAFQAEAAFTSCTATGGDITTCINVPSKNGFLTPQYVESQGKFSVIISPTCDDSNTFIWNGGCLRHASIPNAYLGIVEAPAICEPFALACVHPTASPITLVTSCRRQKWKLVVYQEGYAIHHVASGLPLAMKGSQAYMFPGMNPPVSIVKILRATAGQTMSAETADGLSLADTGDRGTANTVTWCGGLSSCADVPAGADSSLVPTDVLSALHQEAQAAGSIVGTSSNTSPKTSDAHHRAAGLLLQGMAMLVAVGSALR